MYRNGLPIVGTATANSAPTLTTPFLIPRVRLLGQFVSEYRPRPTSRTRDTMQLFSACPRRMALPEAHGTVAGHRCPGAPSPRRMAPLRGPNIGHVRRLGRATQCNCFLPARDEWPCPRRMAPLPGTVAGGARGRPPRGAWHRCGAPLRAPLRAPLPGTVAGGSTRRTCGRRARNRRCGATRRSLAFTSHSRRRR